MKQQQHRKRHLHWNQKELLDLFLKAYEEGNLLLFGAIIQQATHDQELDALIWEHFPASLKAHGIREGMEKRV